LQRGVPYATAAYACNDDGLAANTISKGFSDFESFGIVVKLGICRGRHFDQFRCESRALSLFVKERKQIVWLLILHVFSSLFLYTLI
jgi:hypothetical protein